MTDDLDKLKVSAAFKIAKDFGDMLNLAIGIAAEMHPDMIRHALAKVFNHQAIEEYTRRISDDMANARKAAEDIRELYRTIQDTLDQTDTRIDTLRAEVNALRRELRQKAKT